MVNDELDLLRLCQQTLEDDGHRVDIASSGEDAIQRALVEKPDLLILDWVIPDMDGHELLTRFRSVAALRDVPVLAISALEDGALRADRAGADEFLQKPFDADELIDAVNQMLPRSGRAARESGEGSSPP